MLPHLYPLKDSLLLKTTLASLFSAISALSFYYLSIEYLGLELWPAMFMALGAAILVSILLANMATNASLKVINFLTGSMLIAIGKSENIKRPNKEDIAKPSRDFLANLSNQTIKLSDLDIQKKLASHKELDFYKVMSNNLTQPLITLNKDQIILFANESALKYIELPANEVIGSYFYDAVNLSFVGEETLENWLQGCRDGAVVENERWERVRLNLSNNKLKQFDLTAHYRKDDPTDIELIITFFDRSTVYERDDHDLSFISMAVHELRTPLTIMRGYIEVFEDEISDKLDSEQSEFMHNMSASAQQLSAFVSNILNVARVEENALVLKLVEENWVEVLNNACRDMQLRAKVHDKNIIIDAQDNLPMVGVDKVSIYEVMNNILDNAIKYTHTKENIVIKTYLKDDFVETTITDKGVGVPENLIGHVFEKFYRAHSSKNSVGGTGLGLYLCKAIIQAHGGQIWVSSKEGHGSTFGFTVPLYKNVANKGNTVDDGIVRSAHGWIKNHTLYRG
jgi:signal transduction histidine kinase